MGRWVAIIPTLVLLIAACVTGVPEATPTPAPVSPERRIPTPAPAPTPVSSPVLIPQPPPSVPATIGLCRSVRDCYYLRGWERREDGYRWAVYLSGSGLVEIAIREDAWRR